MIVLGPNNKSNFFKLMVYGVLAALLCSLTPLAMLSIFPLTVAYLFFGKVKAVSMYLIYTAILISSTVIFERPLGIALVYLLCAFISSLIAEGIIRKSHPQKIWIYTSGITLGLLVFFVLCFQIISEQGIIIAIKSSLNDILENVKLQNVDAFKGSEDQLVMLQDLFTEVVNLAPAIMFVSVVASIWVGIFLVLRNHHMWKGIYGYSFTQNHLFKIKTPFWLVWPLIVGLALFLGGEYLLGEPGEILGKNILYMLGVFYFFNGVGIYIDFLNYAKIRGVLRIFLITFTLMVARQFIAILGVIDTWLDIRSFMRKRNKENKDKNEGDIL